MKVLISTLIISLFFLGATAQEPAKVATPQEPVKEKHFKNLKQLTFGGDNAEAYFSFNDKYASFQSNNAKWGLECDQIFVVDVKKGLKDPTARPTIISTGKGRTTCSYFMPDNKHILFASTHLSDDKCPPPLKPYKNRYLWAVYESFDIFVADQKGKIVKQLTNAPGYDAEATISPKGDKIVFTSTRDGDLDLYTMDIDGSNVKRITSALGYDGGAFFSPDGTQLVYRASRPKTQEDSLEYKKLLSIGAVAPTDMEIYVCNVDGSNQRQITHLGKANWAPYFLPGGKKIIFSSNHHSQRGYDFQLYTIKLDGTGLERITENSYFNAFPMFSHDGKKLIFSSNRNAAEGTRDTNLFIADWVE